MLLAPVFNFKFNNMSEEEEYLSMIEDEDDEGFDDSIELCRCCNAYHKTIDDCDIDDFEESFT